MNIDDFSKIIKLISSNFPLFIFVLSVIGLMIGKFRYNTSLFAALEKIAFEQEKNRREQKQQEFQKRITNRYIALGNSLLNVGQLEISKNQFEKALSIDPLNTDAQLGLIKSEIFYSNQNSGYSAEVCRKKIELILAEKPADPHAYTFLADVYGSLKLSEYDDIALSYYEKAISVDPEIAIAHFGIACIYDKRKKLDEALRKYEQAYGLSEWSHLFANNLAYQYVQRKRYKEAINKYQLMVSLQCDYLLPYYSIASCYRLVGNFEESYRYLKQLIKMFEDEKITSQIKNRGEWCFRIDIGDVPVYTITDKKWYAYYSLALTYHCLDDKAHTEKYIEQAELLHIEDVQWINNLISYDIDLLINEQPDLKPKLEEFKNNILK